MKEDNANNLKRNKEQSDQRDSESFAHIQTLQTAHCESIKTMREGWEKKESEMQAYIQSLVQDHLKQIQSLNQIHSSELKRLRELLEEKERWFQDQISAQKTSYTTSLTQHQTKLERSQDNYSGIVKDLEKQHAN